METKIDGLTKAQVKSEETNREDHNKIFDKISEFIKTANKVYATKKDVSDLDKELKDYKKSSSNNTSKGINIALTVLLIVLAIIQLVN